LPHGTPPSLISIVAPVFNEAASLPELVRRIAEAARILEDRYAFEILLVDDGSTDGSLEVAKGLVPRESRLRVIELRRNFGQTAALQAGLDAAHGDILISMDSDLQHFPEDIPLLVAKIEEGYDLVCGWRHDRREGIVRRWPSWAANLIIRRISRLSLQDFGTTFRAYRGDLIRHMRLLGEQHRFVPALAEMVGARIAEVKIRNIERPFGHSSYGLGRTIGVLLDITFLLFSVRYLNRPLRAFGKIAILLSLVGIAIAVWLLGYSLLTGVATVREHSGWFILAAFLLLSSLQIMLVGILAEVLVRIYYRLGGSEAYVIRKEWRAAEIERVR
jgi:glycosyltransferase involved in cell wall biosynthesis